MKISGVTFEPRDPREDDEDGYVFMTIDEFRAGCRATAFTDYDGFGALATEGAISDVRVSPSTFDSAPLPRWATHVAWYNK